MFWLFEELEGICSGASPITISVSSLLAALFLLIITIFVVSPDLKENPTRDSWFLSDSPLEGMVISLKSFFAETLFLYQE